MKANTDDSGRYSEKKDGELFTVDIVGDPEGRSFNIPPRVSAPSEG